MEFKIRRPMITLMNIQYTIYIKYLNIILRVDKCVLVTFAHPIIPLISVPGHDLNSKEFLNQDALLTLSFMLWMELG